MCRPNGRNVGYALLCFSVDFPETTRLQHRDIDLDNLTGLHEINGCGDSCGNWPQGWPVIRRKDEKSQLTGRKILLIPDVLIAGKQEVEPSVLGRLNQRAILKSLPSQFIRPYYLMPSQKPGKRGWSVGVEQYPHATAAGSSRELLAKASA